MSPTQVITQTRHCCKTATGAISYQTNGTPREHRAGGDSGPFFIWETTAWIGIWGRGEGSQSRSVVNPEPAGQESQFPKSGPLLRGEALPGNMDLIGAVGEFRRVVDNAAARKHASRRRALFPDFKCALRLMAHSTHQSLNANQRSHSPSPWPEPRQQKPVGCRAGGRCWSENDKISRRAGGRILRNRILRTEGSPMLRAILTDSHFWLPLGVLMLGLALLLHLA